jgi:hypothetical protein
MYPTKDIYDYDKLNNSTYSYLHILSAPSSCTVSIEPWLSLPTKFSTNKTNMLRPVTAFYVFYFLDIIVATIVHYFFILILTTSTFHRYASTKANQKKKKKVRVNK